jgi:hypothetical protein
MRRLVQTARCGHGEHVLNNLILADGDLASNVASYCRDPKAIGPCVLGSVALSALRTRDAQSVAQGSSRVALRPIATANGTDRGTPSAVGGARCLTLWWLRSWSDTASSLR